MEVGGKRLTLSVFNQIPEEWFFDTEISDEQRDAEFLGWVNHKGQYILFARDGILSKEKFEFERENQTLKRRYDNAKIYLSNANRERHPDLPESEYFLKLKADVVKAKAEFAKSEIDRMAENKKYLDVFDNKSQIYIAI